MRPRTLDHVALWVADRDPIVDFVKINYAYGEGPEVVNKLVDEYATEHNVQNPPLE